MALLLYSIILMVKVNEFDKYLMLGIFDSGIGGLTVLQSVRRRFGEIDIFYLGDHKNVPYGEKSHDEIFESTWNAVKWMFDQGCVIVILACNSASARALRRIQQEKLSEYPGRNVLGVIRPTDEWMLEQGFKKAALFATEATCRSRAYEVELRKTDPKLELSCHSFPSWVPLIESGKVTDEQLDQVKVDVEQALKTLPGVEVIVLACTHYPVLFKAVRSVVPKEIQVVAQGEIVALSLQDYLHRHPEYAQKISTHQNIRYCTTGDAKHATELSQQLMGLQVRFEHVDVSL